MPDFQFVFSDKPVAGEDLLKQAQEEKDYPKARELYKQAIEKFEDAIKSDPDSTDNARIRWNIAEAHYQCGEYDKAAMLYQNSGYPATTLGQQHRVKLVEYLAAGLAVYRSDPVYQLEEQRKRLDHSFKAAHTDLMSPAYSFDEAQKELSVLAVRNMEALFKSKHALMGSIIEGGVSRMIRPDDDVYKEAQSACVQIPVGDPCYAQAQIAILVMQQKAFMHEKKWDEVINLVLEEGASPEVERRWNENVARAYRERALTYEGDGNYAKAIEALDRSLDRDFYDGWGGTYKIMESITTAVAEQDKPLAAKGFLSIGTHSMQEADALLEAAKEKEKEDVDKAEEPYERAMIRYRGACEALHKVLRLMPDSENAHSARSHLGRAYEIQGQYAKALEHYRVVSSESKSEDYARVYYKMVKCDALMGVKRESSQEYPLPSDAKEIDQNFGLFEKANQTYETSYHGTLHRLVRLGSGTISFREMGALYRKVKIGTPFYPQAYARIKALEAMNEGFVQLTSHGEREARGRGALDRRASTGAAGDASRRQVIGVADEAAQQLLSAKTGQIEAATAVASGERVSGTWMAETHSEPSDTPVAFDRAYDDRQVRSAGELQLKKGAISWYQSAVNLAMEDPVLHEEAQNALKAVTLLKPDETIDSAQRKANLEAVFKISQAPDWQETVFCEIAKQYLDELNKTQRVPETRLSLVLNVLGGLMYTASWAEIGMLVGALALGLTPPILFAAIPVGLVAGLALYLVMRMRVDDGPLLKGSLYLGSWAGVGLMIGVLALGVNPFSLMAVAALGAGIGAGIVIYLFATFVVKPLYKAWSQSKVGIDKKGPDEPLGDDDRHRAQPGSHPTHVVGSAGTAHVRAPESAGSEQKESQPSSGPSPGKSGSV